MEELFKSVDEDEHGERHKLFREIGEKFNNRDLNPFHSMKAYLYILLVLVAPILFLGGAIYLLSLVNYSLASNDIVPTIISFMLLGLGIFGTFKINKKMAPLVNKRSNEKIFNKFKENIDNLIGKRKVFKAEYVYQKNKFKGGLESPQNMLLLTYCINKYGLEKGDIKDIVLDYQSRIIYFGSFIRMFMDFRIMLFKIKVTRDIDFEKMIEAYRNIKK